MILLRSRLAAAAVFVIGAVVIAGCGSSSSPSTGSSGTAPSTTAATTTSGGTTTAAATSTGGGASIALQADPGGQLAFVEKTLTAPAGKSTIELTNASSVPHSVEVEGGGKDFGPSTTVSGGAKVTLTIDLPAGTFQYFCAVPGHKEAGMVGTLTVK